MPKRRKEPNNRPSPNQSLPEHLFALREYDLAQGKFVYTAIDEVRDRMFPLLGKITEAACTSLDAKGKPLNRETLLESLEMREIEFDEDGYPGLPAEIRHLFHDPSVVCTCFTDGRFEQYYLHVSSQRKAQIAQLPPPSSEELRTFEKLMEKKRREFNDRKRHRQLPR